ncbi:MAG TPA: GxGYxYP domain-containing protein [Candidatus Sulfotelmatobacter sp.]|nr:GxGYxYP domain-containing protein [Candidatus Sulfotelmatobacter sp.]
MKPKFFLRLALVLGGGLCNIKCEAASGMFPKMPAATNVYVVGVKKEGISARMTTWAMQGLINQKSAEVYTINNPWDWEPLKDCGKPYEELANLPGEDAGLINLFQKYQGRVEKMFVYDPDKDWTWYLALMSGAQQDGIPVTQDIKDDLISEFGWNGEVIDYRNRWNNRIEAYDWALVNLMPNCNKHVIFTVKMGQPMDYVVASKGFIFWLNLNDERAEIQKIFSTEGYGVGTSLMGYGNGGDRLNEVANSYGIGYLTGDYADASFWSSFPDTTHTQAPGRAIRAEPGKIYASIMWSDGDNLEFDQNPLYKFWHDPAHGEIPVATALSPTLQELNAPLLDWYYSRMTTNDELMCGPAGVQFIYIDCFNDDLFPAWCRLTHEWCNDAGFHTVRIWRAPHPSAKFNLYMKTCGFTGVLGEGPVIQAGFPPKIDTYAAGNEEQLYEKFLSIQPNPQRPVFVSFTPIVQGFYQGDHGYSAIKREINRLNQAYPGRYVFLLTKDQFATMRAYYHLPAN